MTRIELGKKYGNGLGIEVGAFHNPWPVPGKVTYADKKTRAELFAQFPECQHKPIVETDIITSAETLEGVDTESFDFLCSSHVLEHMENPLSAIENWLRVVKPGGHLMIAVPDKRFTFDRGRRVTSYEHLLGEYLYPGTVADNRIFHLIEYFVRVDKNDIEVALKRAREMPKDADIHFHCWDEQVLNEMFEKFSELVKTFKIVEWFLNGQEVILVLEKL
jgi:predicted SAM-dependent methyltransferase